MHDLYGMEIEKSFSSALQAFDHLVENWEGSIPSELRGSINRRNGEHKTPLGVVGAKSMLKRFGRGRYEVSEVVTYNSEQP